MSRNEQNSEALTAGKRLSGLKLASNTAASVASLFLSPALAARGFAISLGGSLAADTFAYTNEPAKASIAVFSGSGKTVIDKARSRGIEALTLKVGYNITSSARSALAKPALILSIFFNWKDYQNDMKNFE